MKWEKRGDNEEMNIQFETYMHCSRYLTLLQHPLHTHTRKNLHPSLFVVVVVYYCEYLGGGGKKLFFSCFVSTTHKLQPIK